MSAVGHDPRSVLALMMYSVALTALCFVPHSYGMRFIAKVLKDSLHEKFPDAGEDELLKVRI